MTAEHRLYRLKRDAINLSFGITHAFNPGYTVHTIPKGTLVSVVIEHSQIEDGKEDIRLVTQEPSRESPSGVRTITMRATRTNWATLIAYNCSHQQAKSSALAANLLLMKTILLASESVMVPTTIEEELILNGLAFDGDNRRLMGVVRLMAAKGKLSLSDFALAFDEQEKAMREAVAGRPEPESKEAREIFLNDLIPAFITPGKP